MTTKENASNQPSAYITVDHEQEDGTVSVTQWHRSALGPLLVSMLQLAAVNGKTSVRRIYDLETNEVYWMRADVQDDADEVEDILAEMAREAEETAMDDERDRDHAEWMAEMRAAELAEADY